MKIIWLAQLLLCSLFTAAQFNDTIIKKTGEQIICEITFVNEVTIFYKYSPKKKLIKSAYLELSKVNSYTKNSEYFKQIIQKPKELEEQVVEEELKSLDGEYMAWIYRINNSSFKGHLKITTDSSVVIITNPYNHKRKLEYDISYLSINMIKVRNENRVGIGIAIGIGTGFLTSALFGYAIGADECGSWDFTCYTRGQMALILGVPGAIIGLGIGAIAGSTKIKIPIGGKESTYKKQRKKINQYLIP